MDGVEGSIAGAERGEKAAGDPVREKDDVRKKNREKRECMGRVRVRLLVLSFKKLL